MVKDRPAEPATGEREPRSRPEQELWALDSRIPVEGQLPQRFHRSGLILVKMPRVANRWGDG